MASKIKMLAEKGLLKVKPDYFPISNLILEVIAGGHSYGISNNDSDIDIIGVCMPPIEVLSHPWQEK